MTTSTTTVTPSVSAVATSIAAMPVASSNPTITIASASTATQTVTNFSVDNFGSNLYGIQVGVSNLPTGSTSTLVNNVTGWTPSSVTQGQSISNIAIDFTLSNPLPSPSTGPVDTLTINQGNLTTPLNLSNFTLTAKNSSGKFADLGLLTMGYNVNITGNVGYTIPASNASGSYSGGTGLNTLVFSDVYSKYKVAALGNNNFTVTYNTNAAVDSIQSFQRLKFQDVGVAYDLSGAAGQVAKILGAVYGASAVTNSTYVGIGLNYLNQGMSYSNLITLALNNKLGTGFTNAAEVTLLFQNLAHANPGAQDMATWTNQITNGTYTQTSLAQFACDNAINTANINLTGLMQTGLQYS